MHGRDLPVTYMIKLLDCLRRKPNTEPAYPNYFSPRPAPVAGSFYRPSISDYHLAMSNTGRSPIKASNRLQAAAVGGAAVIGLFYYQWRGQQVQQASKEDSSNPARLPTCECLSDHIPSPIWVALKLTLGLEL
jgi:hypothetical protein